MLMLRLTEGDQSGGFWGRAVGRRVPSGKQAEGKESPLLVPKKESHTKERVTSDIPGILLFVSLFPNSVVICRCVHSTESRILMDKGKQYGHFVLSHVLLKPGQCNPGPGPGGMKACQRIKSTMVTRLLVILIK